MKAITKLPSLPPRPPDAHKGDFGRVLIFAGSRDMPGAAVLAARAALRGGAGLVTLAVPRGTLGTVQSHLVDATFLPLPDTRAGGVSRTARRAILEAASQSRALVAGPGLGASGETKAMVYELIRKASCPLLLDADALNVLGEDLGSLQERPGPTVLTPHPGEMARLFGLGTKEIQADRREFAARCARRSHAVVILKGHRTVVTDGGVYFENTTGNPGMAKGGMGDVLAGFLGALLARGLEPLDAAILGVYIHGFAGDLAAQKFGQESLIASDVVAALPEAFSREPHPKTRNSSANPAVR